MATRKFSTRHILFAGTFAVAIAIGPVVAGLTAPGATGAPSACTSNVSTASAALNCSPGSTTGLIGAPTEQQLTTQNMFDHNNGGAMAR
jgi:hypothetical protein